MTGSATEALPPHRVVTEEEVYRFQPANNGSGPLWCTGDTTLVRTGTHLFASGLETIPGTKPLNNCRWTLFRRNARGWELVHKDDHGRTREPCPLAGFHDGRLFLSANPTLTAPDTYGGPAQPQVYEFSAIHPRAVPKLLLPQWSAPVTFTEHSYRHFVTDGAHGELILFQNLDYDSAYWSFFDREGRWSACGRLTWPWGADYEVPQPIRLCYCNVQLRDRAVFVWGTSDINEPVKTWRNFKFKLTGREWDYDFRRLFFSWTPDVARTPFHPWIEIASREKTAGHLQNCDMWITPEGHAHLLWCERALDERLREAFFPKERQHHALNYAFVRDGRVVTRRVLAEGGEGLSNEIPNWGRFHVMEDGRLFVVFSVTGKDVHGDALAENRVVEIRDGNAGPTAKLRLKHPFAEMFFTASARAGSPPADAVDILGLCVGQPQTLRYARVDLNPQNTV